MNLDRPGFEQFAIRGISAANPVTGGSIGEQTVGVYLDDVSLTMPIGAGLGAAVPAFFDIAQVEVLRGPQGTLYGSGSMGGTLRIVSNQPDATHSLARLKLIFPALTAAGQTIWYRAC